MKSAKLMCITAMALLVALAIPVSLAAQERPAKHHHYTLTDIGTRGGPNVIFNFSGFPNHLLGSDGTVTGGADTTTVDPYCFDNPDCFVEHAFKWHKHVLTDLGALPGGRNSQSFWINDAGQIAGFAQNGKIDPLLNIPILHAVLWGAKGRIIDIGTFGGYESLSQAINKWGQVVGLAANATPDPNAILNLGQQARAFLWQKGKMRDLGTLGTGNDAFAAFVNERGQVAGFAYTDTTPNSENTYWCGNKVPTADPFFWDGTKMWDVGTLGGNCGVALGLNNQGQVVGVSYFAGDFSSHGFRWDKNNKLQDLATLGGTNSGTSGISEAGDAVGWAYKTGNVAFHAVIWPRGKKKPTDLGVLTGYPSGFAAAINSKGQITGGLTNTAGACPPSHSAAFLWENGDMVDLNTLVPPHPGIQLTGCDAYINDRGEIVTLGIILSDGDTHAFLLIPKKTR
jgi:probable HAF family extracellular repeat protein